MRNIKAEGYSMPQAYHDALTKLYQYGELTDCADWNCKQLECRMTIEITNPLQEPMISRLGIFSPADLQQYKMEMLHGILDFEIERGNWEYTYHDRYKDQVNGVIRELSRNPSSRRACMTIRRPEDIKSKEPPCLQHIQYFVRHGHLECDILFRSNDACKATFMNMFALAFLQKWIADELYLPVGQMVYSANSFHAYEKDFKLLESYCDRIFSMHDICYDYDGDWKEQMQEAIPEIMKKVKELESRGVE